jgi:transcriptional regulator with XRE-family HTH domain
MGQRLRTMVARLRKQQRVTQLQLARRVGVSEAYICQLETGARTNPSLTTLKKLAKALDVTLAELVG